MNISCKIIEDILPLYADEVCSEESRALVNEHVAECEKCRKKLGMMSDTGNEKADIRPLKNVGRWLEKLRLKTLIKGIVSGALIIGFIVFSIYFLTESKILYVPAERVTVSDICMLSDGNIAFHMFIDDDYDLNLIECDVDDNGNMYIKPRRSIIENRRLEDLTFSFTNTYYGVEIHEFDLKTGRDTNPYLDFFFTAGVEPKAVYLRLRGEDVLIWEKGMELPPASEEVEERFERRNMEGNG